MEYYLLRTSVIRITKQGRQVWSFIDLTEKKKSEDMAPARNDLF